MKKLSIRTKITIWYTLALIVIVGLTMLVVYITSGIVLRNTIREYLISVVEENTDKIVYVEKDEAEKEEYGDSVKIEYGSGYLIIDDDYMNTVHDVHTALYTQKGELVYGENPLALETEGINFLESQLWTMTKDGTRYNLYDRKLKIDAGKDEELWLRGIVSEEENVAKLQNIINISLMILPFLIIIAVIFGYMISGRMLRPVREMESVADQISMGSDLKQRLYDSGNGDELSKLAKTFNGMISRLDSSFEKERRFTSDASHELRTPMAVILAQTEYTLEKDRTEEEYKEALQVISRQGERMNILINDMLDYTRMDQSSERYEMEELDLSLVTKETAEQMSMLSVNNIRLHADVVPDVIIKGNRMLLSRMIGNLISNAYRYGREGGYIKVSLKTDRQRPVLCVQDNGIGISEEEQEKIFDRFYRSDASRTVKGTGLGLSMVKKIAELHGAEIKLESKVGVGSSFYIIFKQDDTD